MVSQPAYGEYVKFFRRISEKSWKDDAECSFPELYHDELGDFVALSGRILGDFVIDTGLRYCLNASRTCRSYQTRVAWLCKCWGK